MASAADICNIALGILGVGKIMSLDQRKPEAEACATVYSMVRDAMLSEFNWRFATQDVRLMPLSEEVIGVWGHVYASPVDCLRVQMVIDPNGYELDGAPFTIGFEGRVYTDIPNAIARVTMRVTNEGAYPPHFIDAFSKRLAVELAGTLQNVANRMEYAANLYNIAADAAMTVDAGLGKPKPERIPMIDARSVYGGGEWR